MPATALRQLRARVNRIHVHPGRKTANAGNGIKTLRQSRRTRKLTFRRKTANAGNSKKPKLKQPGLLFCH